MSCLMKVDFTVASAFSIIRESSSHSRSSKLTLTWWLHLLATGGRPPLQNRFVIKIWIKWWCIAEPLPAAGLNMGCPTSEDILHIARLFRGNISYPKPFGEPKRHLAMLCMCVHPSYYETGDLIRYDCPVCHSGCTKVVLLPVSCQRRTLKRLGAYIKLQKFAFKSKRREKILTPYA